MVRKGCTLGNRTGCGRHGDRGVTITMTYTDEELEESARRIKRQYTQRWYEDPSIQAAVFLFYLVGVPLFLILLHNIGAF